MARKRQRVHYQLSDISQIREPSVSDIKIILRAADDIIFVAGRSMLAKILKGSKDKKLLEKQLQSCPSYGYFHDMTIDEIGRLVDWMLINDYLDIEYNGQLPMIVFAAKGWQLYKPVYADELYRSIEAAVTDNIESVIARLKTANREVIILLLQKIALEKNFAVIPFLRQWQNTEVKKVRALIAHTLSEISRGFISPDS